MHLSEAVRDVFDPGVRRRGEAYVNSRVSDLAVRNETAYASVLGTEPYDVTIFLYPQVPSVEWACSCPFFEDHGPLDPCKHIWATLRAAGEKGALRIDPELAGSIEIMDDDVSEDEEEWDDYWGVPDSVRNTLFPSASRQPSSPLPPMWRRVMYTVRGAMERAPRPEEPVKGEILYGIDVSSPIESHRLMLYVLHHREKKKGGWTKPKSFGTTPRQIEKLPDPRDRHFVTLLHGANSMDEYRRRYDTESAFLLPRELIPILLPRIAETGRLCFWDQYRASDELPRLRYDDGPPWVFELFVRKAPDRECYVVDGRLTRDDVSMPLSEPLLLAKEGWVFTNNSFARLEHGDAFPWIAALRGEGTLDVPLAEADAWFSELLSCARVPPVDLPPELACEFIQGTPSPVLRVSAPPRSSANRGAYFGATLSFDYGEASCYLHAENSRWFDPENRRVIERDKAAEMELKNRLFDVGFRQPKAGNAYSYGQTVHAEVAPRKFAGAIRTLMAEEWHVEADGRKCRVGGAVSVSVSSGIDWFDVEGHVSFDDVSVPLPAVLAALKRGETTIVLDDGTFGVVPEQWLKRFSPLAGAAALDKEGARFARSQVALLDALLAAEANVTCDETFRRLRDELLTFSSVEPADPPEGFVGALRGYQREGLGWLHFLRRFGFGGCLADDMGLGKTVQALAALAGCYRNGGGTSLVVVPRSLVLNWMQEAERFAPQLKVLNHTGTDRRKSTEHLSEYDLVLTTYGTLRRDVTFLREFEFEYVILDEAQAIKNANTAAAKAARLLRGRNRLAMSGTPIENHLGELWSLFEFLNPGMLGTATVFSSVTSGNGANVDGDMRELLSHALRPFILRRTKQQVASDLPEKTEETIYCELAPAQRKLYNELRGYYRQNLLAKVDKTGIGKAKIMVLEALLRLRQAACHPGLIDKKKAGHASAKLDVLLGQLEDVAAEGHNVLVFSQFTSMLAIVRSRLDTRKICYEYLDGRTRNRAERVERFQTDAECGVFLISLKAGGLGLNLTAADYVVLLDPWWNPAVEAQAIDRAHRIGQTRPVFAYRLVAKDTVEERILELQKSKRALADSIITADNSLIRDLSREDLELLLA